MALTRFAAIDFETANHDGNSACAVGVVIVEGEHIVGRITEKIRPPSRQFVFTHIHGLTWTDVQDAPAFDDVWRRVAPELAGVRFLAAHNAPFDRGVLGACCATYGLPLPPQPFVCTVRVARSQWNIYPTKLPDVCRHLGIELRHHQADSDAEACARIVLAAKKAGWRYRGL